MEDKIADLVTSQLVAAIMLGIYTMVVGVSIEEVWKSVREIFSSRKKYDLSCATGMALVLYRLKGAKRLLFLIIGMFFGYVNTPGILQDTMSCWSVDLTKATIASQTFDTSMLVKVVNVVILGCLVFMSSKVAIKIYRTKIVPLVNDESR